MAVYVFSLLVGYVPSGIDYAQGVRYKYLKNLSQPVKYVFTSLPTERYICRYEQMGIDVADMISAHFCLSGNEAVGDSAHITERTYYSKNNLKIKEFYSDRLLYTDYYTVYEGNDISEHKLIKRSFRKMDGTLAYDMLFDEGGNERYLFPNGENLSKSEFLCKFIQRLELTEEDVVLIDRPSYMEFVQPLFMYGNRAKIMVFLHSGHYAEKGEASEFVSINYEYNYWFKYSDHIHTIIVSTERQREELIDKLKEYGCHVPEVAVVPISGLSRLRYPIRDRRACSLMTASRIVPRKKIDWIIRSVIKAHEVNEQITLDVYGKGDDEDTVPLEKLVEANHAEGYIRFMGHLDMMENLYTEYEAYITMSLWETYGLSLLEAIGSGNAVLGLDVKYGNSLFIQNESNGYLLDFDFQRIDEEQYINELVEEMAEKIIQLFSQKERLDTFQKKSYEIALNYSDDVVGRKWVKLMENALL